MSRGIERRNIFDDSRDRRTFLGLLEKVGRRHQWQCLAYCLLDNHYHLIVRTPLPNLSRGMQVLNSGYAASFNARRERVGHLFQGRFRSVLIRSPDHLLTALRYVVRNPVAAGFCRRPTDWPWSSYRATLSDRAPSLVSAELTLACFGRDGERRERFERFVGDDELELFEREEACAFDFPTEPTGPDASRPPVEAVLAANPGDAGIDVAYHDHAYSLRQIASALGCSRSLACRRLVAYESAQMLASAV